MVQQSLYVLAFTLTFSQMLIACKPNNRPLEQPHENLAKVNGQPLSQTQTASTLSPTLTTKNSKDCNNQAIHTAFNQKNENQKIQLLGCGKIKKILSDDNDGSRHQKFLISVDGYPQMTVLIAHNIDLAERVDTLQPNLPIKFYGEYIYNQKGGVVHWTHKDPTARHQDGWLEANGKKYW